MLRYVLFLSLFTAVMSANAQQLVTVRSLDADSITARLADYTSAIRASGQVDYMEANNNTLILQVMDYTDSGKQNGCLGFVIAIDTMGSGCKSTRFLVTETECGEGAIPPGAKEAWFELHISHGPSCGPPPYIMTGERYSVAESGKDIPGSGDSNESSLRKKLEYYLSVLEEVSRR
jgi:hypothetical protein